ncbi:MAG: hypothetical protein QNJ32_16005 [Xenococcaceae cyanobacterium MO_167.B27]|nr:hypothetical protein [Xenococcaceae cyanobacterium MO_167.B27]
MSNLLVHNLIDSCLRIEQQRVSPRRTIPEQIIFDFNQDILDQIIALRNNQQQIELSADNLAELRYYFLVNILESPGLGITFKTYYQKQEEKITIIKSVIYLSGKGEQFIPNEALPFKEEIIELHYWLIEQIFRQIPFKYQRRNSILWWSLLGLIFFFLALITFWLMPLVFWVEILLLLVFTDIILRVLPYFLNQYLSSWLLHQLLLGFFSYSPKRRKIGLYLLSTLLIEY